MAELSHFVFNSDYPMDKIVYLKEGSFTMGNLDHLDTSFENPLKVQLYMKGLFSFDDWETAYTFGMAEMDGLRFTLDSSASATEEKIMIMITKEGTAGKEVKYKIWGVMEESATLSVDVPPTYGYSYNKLMLDSDYNYPRLIAEGHLSAGETYEHGLGYIPFADMWYTSPYEDGYALVNDNNPENPVAWLTEDSIAVTTFIDLLPPGGSVYFRIYA